jgi:hypothetical protein
MSSLLDQRPDIIVQDNLPLLSSQDHAADTACVSKHAESCLVLMHQVSLDSADLLRHVARLRVNVEVQWNANSEQPSLLVMTLWLPSLG